MRKIILFVFTALLILCSAGCGKKEVPSSVPSSSGLSSRLQTTPEPDNSSSFEIISKDNDIEIPTVPDIPETPKVDTSAIEEELAYLAANRPSVLIDCTFCGGSGRESIPCDTCGGSGRVPIPGVTMFAAFAPCSDCRGDGYAVCGQCTFGLMINPDYETESAAWTEQRHNLWHQLGYSDEEIRRIEIQEAKDILESDSNNILPSDGHDGFISNETAPGICRICYGTGDCDTCGGDGFYQNMFTGEQQKCPNCTDGRCWKCGGSGQAA